MHLSQTTSSKSAYVKRPYQTPSLRSVQIDDMNPAERLSFGNIKYLFVNDSYAESRFKYIAAMLCPDQIIAKHAIYDDVIPNSNRDTDILLVGGNDHRRLGALMRVNNLLFLTKPKICLSEKADVAKHVYLLQSGFDAVINPAVTEPLEACHRIAAIWARYLRTNADFRKNGRFIEALLECCFYDALSKQERQVFDILFDKMGEVATYAQLREAASLDHMPVTHNHLRVLIGFIRLKLLNGWTISCRREEGYMLQK